MSRTDKDRPAWVVAFYEGTVVHDHRDGVCVVQTLDQVGGAHRPSGRRETEMEMQPTCEYVCERDLRFLSWYEDPPRAFVRHTWHAPERTRERVALRQATQRANAELQLGYGALVDDFDFPNYQTRGGARWLYN